MVKRYIAAFMVVAVGILGFSVHQASAAAFTQGDYNDAISKTVQPLQDAVTGFLANGWLIIVSLIILVTMVLLAWKLGFRGLRKLFRLGK